MCGGVIAIFAVLHLEQAEKYRGFRRKLYQWGGCSPKVRTVDAPFVSFFMIETVISDHGVVWRKVKKAAGVEAERLLLPCGVRPPAHCGIRGYEDDEYRRRLLVNFVLDAVREASRQTKLELVLVDIAGRCAGVAAELSERVAALRVLTLRPRQYDGCCAYCLRKYGAAPMLSEDPRIMRNASLVLAPYGFQETCLPPADSIVFAQGSGRIGMTVPPEAVVLERKYLDYMPPGISPSAFAAALCESGRIPELATMVPLIVEQYGRKISLNEAVRKMFT